MSDTAPNLSLEERMPAAFQQLVQAGKVAEFYFGDVCDMEFTVQNGRLFILNVRHARKSPIANLRTALQFFVEGKIAPQDVLRRISCDDVAIWMMPVIKNINSIRLTGKGVPACGGIATGRISFNESHAMELAGKNVPVILARNEVSPEDLRGILNSQGILTTRGGVSSHAALVSRHVGKPCVCGYSSADLSPSSNGEVRSLFREGSWVTINGLTGEVFEGKAKCEILNWREIPELVALAELVRWGVIRGHAPHDVVGQVWRLSDFFLHGSPLLSPKTTKKRSVSRSSFASFAPSGKYSLKDIQRRLIPLETKDLKNYREMLLSLTDTLFRLLSSAVGIGNHPQYFRPLWDPKQSVRRLTEDGGRQVLGFQFYDINCHVHHLVDIATVTFYLEIEVFDDVDEWFLDFTNPAGESLVRGSESVQSYCLLLNDAEVRHEDLPSLYDSLRRRELGWSGFSRHNTTYSEVVGALAVWDFDKSEVAPIREILFELGLIRKRGLTLAGRSLLGEINHNRTYE